MDKECNISELITTCVQSMSMVQSQRSWEKQVRKYTKKQDDKQLPEKYIPGKEKDINENKNDHNIGM